MQWGVFLESLSATLEAFAPEPETLIVQRCETFSLPAGLCGAAGLCIRIRTIIRGAKAHPEQACTKCIAEEQLGPKLKGTHQSDPLSAMQQGAATCPRRGCRPAWLYPFQSACIQVGSGSELTPRTRMAWDSRRQG